MKKKDTFLASRLKKRIEIEQPTETIGEAGEFTVTWQNFTTLWAEITPSRGARGKEIFSENQLQDTNTHHIIIRYISGINTNMRVKFKGRLFNIRAIINPYEENEMLELFVEEGVAI